MSLKLLKLDKIVSVKVLAWKYGSLNFFYKSHAPFSFIFPLLTFYHRRENGKVAEQSQSLAIHRVFLYLKKKIVANSDRFSALRIFFLQKFVVSQLLVRGVRRGPETRIAPGPPTLQVSKS